MPKRLCPFANEYHPQIKTFVTEQKVNCGVAQAERMDAVYEKTTKLLFDAVNLNKCTCNVNAMTRYLNQENMKKNMCNFCQINDRKLYYEKLVFVLHRHSRVKPVIVTFQNISTRLKKLEALCYICNHPSENQCNYCDKHLCHDCGMCCCQCDLIFCNNCSCNVFIGELDNVATCFSCLK